MRNVTKILSVLAIICVAIVLLSVDYSYDMQFRKSGKEQGDEERGAWRFKYYLSLPIIDTFENRLNSEATASLAEHLNLITSILSCLKLNYYDFESLPSGLQKQFITPRQYMRPSSLYEAKIPPEPAPRISGYYRSITELSSLISDQRAQLAASMQGSRLLLQELQISSIILGIITTILVGIKSGASNPRRLDILAIIFAALGTGVASLIAFYNPREEYVRTARAISQLSQLQSEISFLLGSEKACDPTDAGNAKLLIDWYGKFSAISNSSETFADSPPEQQEHK